MTRLVVAAVAAVALAATFLGPSGANTLVNGPPVALATDAPWSVLINAFNSDASTVAGCTGSIVSASVVLTAAHCLHDSNGTPWARLTLAAGVVDADDLSTLQYRDSAFSAITTKVHPGYRKDVFGDDVATLTLAVPFDITGPSVRAVELPPQGTSAPPWGTTVRVAGWGRTAASGRSDRREHYVDSLVQPSWICATGVPSVLCTQAATGATCPGDSGAGAVTTGSTPILVGVVNVESYFEEQCVPGNRTWSTDLASPEIAAWLRNASTVLAPVAPDGRASISGLGAFGETLICQSPRWSSAETTDYQFFWDDSAGITAVDVRPTLLQTGASDKYRVRLTDSGHKVMCVARATNAGGMTASGAPTRVAIAIPSATAFLSEGPIVARNGRFYLRIRVAHDAVNARAQFAWIVRTCKKCRRYRTSSGVMTLGAKTEVRMPDVPVGSDSDLRITMPQVRSAGVTFPRGTTSFSFETS